MAEQVIGLIVDRRLRHVLWVENVEIGAVV